MNIFTAYSNPPSKHCKFHRNTLKRQNILLLHNKYGKDVIIKKHNSKILKKKSVDKEKLYNCRASKKFLMNGKCLTNCIILYKVEVEASNGIKIYYGASESKLKHNATITPILLGTEDMETIRAVKIHLVP